jgi:hypothetical protein
MAAVFVSTGSDFFLKREKKPASKEKMWKIVDCIAEKKRVNGEYFGYLLKDRWIADRQTKTNKRRKIQKNRLTSRQKDKRDRNARKTLI